MASKFDSSKISIPHLPKCLLRHRVFAQLPQAGERSAVWIDSPPGAGKTTLASSYLDYCEYSHIWYRVDRSDNDVASFFYWLGLATCNCAPDNKEKMALFTPEYSLGLDTFSRNFFDELYSRLKPPFVLVFDNYQLLQEDSLTHDVIIWAIEYLPSGGSIQIISREKPVPQFARLLANRLIKNISWEQLKLQTDEFAPLLEVISDYPIDDDTRDKLMTVSDGWISGVILYLQNRQQYFQPDSSDHANFPISGTPETLFNYFTKEVLSGLSKRRNQFLRAISLLPNFNLQMAIELTGNDEAQEIIRYLLAKNHFINMLGIAPTRYELHPLFREYLLAQPDLNFSERDWNQIQLNASTILERDGQYEQALVLLIKTGDNANAVRVLCTQAMKQMQQGQHETIRHWISLFPSDVVQQSPWLSYWEGISHLGITPNQAIVILEKTYPQFKQQSDVLGMYLSWAAIADAYAYAWNDYSSAGVWVDEFDWLRKTYPEYPSPDIKMQVTFSAVSIYMWCRPDHRSYKTLLQTAIAMTQDIPVNDTTIHGLNAVCLALCFQGRIDESRKILEAVENRIDHVSPTVYVFNSMLKCYLGSFGIQDYVNVNTLVEATIEFANNLGVHIFTSNIFGLDIYFSVQIDNPVRALNQLAEMKKTADPKRLTDYGHFRYLAGLASLSRGDYFGAEEAFSEALDYATRACATHPIAISHCGLALALLEQGKCVDAERHLQKVFDASRKLDSIALTCFADATAAYAYLKNDDTDKADPILRKMLTTMRQHEFCACPCFYTKCFAKLAARAYRTGVETEVVDKMIRHFTITPYDDQDRVEQWPWPCRITLLGDYRIELNGSEPDANGKTAKKPKELLLALATAPKQTLSLNRTADLMWPDAEGDLARISLKSTIRRLRLLLQDARHIIVHDGRIRLDTTRLFCDLVEFDRAVLRLEQTRGQCESDLQTLTSLYQGDLADGCDAYDWLPGIREKYRNRYHAAVRQLREKSIYGLSN